MQNQTELKSFREGNQEGEQTLEGRVMLRRNLGKMVFLTLKDQSGSAQIALKKDTLGENYQGAKSGISTGDLVKVRGFPFLTKTNERTLDVGEFKVQAKCHGALPDKHKGVTKEVGRTNRGIEIMTSQDAMNTFVKRNKIVREIRDYLYSQGFQEVDTGILQKVTNTSPSSDFTTHSNYFDRDLFLRKTPELRLKQLLVGGMRNIFEMGKNFRNEGVAKQYHPEYTILELYQNGATHEDLLKGVYALLEHLNESVGRPESDPTNVTEVQFYDFIRDELGIDARRGGIKDLLSKIDERIRKDYGNDERLHRGYYNYDLFRTALKRVPGENIVLHGVPKEISVLGKTYDADPSLVEEFRYFVRGNLICNGITELTDYEEQRRRIMQQAETLVKPLDTNDNQFLDLVKLGLPSCAGLGLGLEKTLMVYLGKDDIRDVIYYPL